jgi:protoporphyrinogen oxidase
MGVAKRLPRRSAPIKTLVTEFEYPRLGPGQMWEAFRAAVESGGGTIRLGSQVIGVHHHAGRITGIVTSSSGTTSPEPAGHVISSMPIRDLVRALVPAAPDNVRAAAERLSYRDFITVAVVVNEPDVFPDNWIYIHEAAVKVGRIQNFKNWSADMVPDPAKTCLGLEYFCTEGDELWSRSDEDLVALAREELRTLGLVDAAKISDGHVMRVRKAYPVYDEGYEEALAVIKQYLARFENLQLIGRNGMHKYNNQDHSMVTAMLAVRNLFGEQHDLWAINSDDEYQEGPAAAAVSGLAADHAVRDQLAATQPNQPTRLPAHTG